MHIGASMEKRERGEMEEAAVSKENRQGARQASLSAELAKTGPGGASYCTSVAQMKWWLGRLQNDSLRSAVWRLRIFGC